MLRISRDLAGWARKNYLWSEKTYRLKFLHKRFLWISLQQFSKFSKFCRMLSLIIHETLLKCANLQFDCLSSKVPIKKSSKAMNLKTNWHKNEKKTAEIITRARSDWNMSQRWNYRRVAVHFWVRGRIFDVSSSSSSDHDESRDDEPRRRWHQRNVLRNFFSPFNVIASRVSAVLGISSSSVWL